MNKLSKLSLFILLSIFPTFQHAALSGAQTPLAVTESKGSNNDNYAIKAALLLMYALSADALVSLEAKIESKHKLCSKLLEDQALNPAVTEILLNLSTELSKNKTLTKESPFIKICEAEFTFIVSLLSTIKKANQAVDHFKKINNRLKTYLAGLMVLKFGLGKLGKGASSYVSSWVFNEKETPELHGIFKTVTSFYTLEAINFLIQTLGVVSYLTSSTSVDPELNEKEIENTVSFGTGSISSVEKLYELIKAIKN